MVLSHPTRSLVLPAVVVGGCGVFLASWRMLSGSLLKTSVLAESFNNLADRAGPSWFLWHPLFAIMGTVVLPIPAVILRQYKGYWSKKIHALVFSASLACTIASLYFIFTAKDAKAKPHMTTPHAWAGLVVSLGYVASSFSGIFGLDPDLAVLGKGSELKKKAKWWHTNGGRVWVTGGYWVCFSGWYKFYNKGNDMWAGILVASAASLLTFIDTISSLIDSRIRKAKKAKGL